MSFITCLFFYRKQTSNRKRYQTLHYYVWKSANYGTETVWNAMVEINKKIPIFSGLFKQIILGFYMAN